MALGMGTEPIANSTAIDINIDDVYINFDELFQGLQKPSIIIISIASILSGLAVLIII
ncbi:unnamed protein product, partial [Rotaria sp. Silwood2]